MVILPEGYCIDSTEVTRDQYAAWLATNPALPSIGDANCGWNTTFAPDADCMSSSTVCEGTGCGNHPQSCVNWCDAYAYCAGVGKRLCGNRGGGANSFDSYMNENTSQWYNACASGSAANNYPYGKTYYSATMSGPPYYSATACNGPELGNGSTTAVGSLSGCQASGPYAGVYDLSGNVSEWEDSCNSTGQSAFCHFRGGNFFLSGDFLACNCDIYGERQSTSSGIGFRCCSP